MSTGFVLPGCRSEDASNYTIDALVTVDRGSRFVQHRAYGPRCVTPLYSLTRHSRTRLALLGGRSCTAVERGGRSGAWNILHTQRLLCIRVTLEPPTPEGSPDWRIRFLTERWLGREAPLRVDVSGSTPLQGPPLAGLHGVVVMAEQCQIARKLPIRPLVAEPDRLFFHSRFGGFPIRSTVSMDALPREAQRSRHWQ